MADDRDPPIVDQDFTSGLKVVDIGDYRVSRGWSRRNFSSCPHRQVVYDQRERRIWCKDCEHDVEPFDAFVGVAQAVDRELNKLQRRAEELAEAEKFQARSLAVKALDKVWRRRDYVPACPHCGFGLFPENFKNGVATLSKEYAAAIAAKVTKLKG